MKITRFRARSVGDAVEMVKAALGEEAVIMDVLTLKDDGRKVVEVVAAIDEEPIREGRMPLYETKVASHPHSRRRDAPKAAHRSLQSPPRVLGFIGLHGCGKTTALLKFALFLQKRGVSISLVNLDQKRLGAREALKRAADLVGVPFQNVFDPIQLLKAVTSRPKSEMVLVDFPGVNFFDHGELEGVKRYFLALPNLHSIGVVEAHLHPSDRASLMERFNSFSPWATFFSKTDLLCERKRLWEILASATTNIVYLSKGEKITSGLEEFYTPKPHCGAHDQDIETEVRGSISGI